MRRPALLVLALAAVIAPASTAVAQFSSSSYNADKVFPNGSPNQHPTGMAWDGSSYWSVDGGSTNGVRLTSYSSSGSVTNTYSPGLDFRSVFTSSSGVVYGRQFSDPTIYVMTTPGVFNPFVTLIGGSLDAQSSVVLNGAGTEFIAMLNGNVDRWALSGAHIGSTSLIGYGVGCEFCYGPNRGIASFGSDWLTYDGTTLSMWDTNGNRVDTATLNGAGTSFDSYFSFSRADDGRVWIADDLRGNWRGYPIGSQTVTPEPASMTLLATGLMGVLAAVRLKRKGALTA